MQFLALIFSTFLSASAAPQPAPEAPDTPEAEAPLDEVEPDVLTEEDEEDGTPITGAAAVTPPVEAPAPRTPPAPPQLFFNNAVDIQGTAGDIMAMGNSVRINGEVGDNAVLMGRTVTIRYPVGGDVMAMGQIIKVDAPITGDLYAMGAEIQVTEDGGVGGTIVGTAQRIVVDAAIEGDVSLRSEQLELDGPIAGDASLTFGQLDLGKDAKIDGSLRYVAPNTHDDLVAITNGDAAYSLGDDVDVPTVNGPFQVVMGLIRGLLRAIGSYLAQLLVGVLMLMLLGEFARRPAKTIGEQPIISMVLGFAVLIAVPVVTILLGFIFTLLWRDVDLLSGMIAAATPPLGAAAVTVWGFGFIVGRILTALMLGELVLGRLAPDRKDHATSALAAGLVPLVLLSAVPWLDFAVWTVATALGLGGTWLYLRVASKEE